MCFQDTVCTINMAPCLHDSGSMVRFADATSSYKGRVGMEGAPVKSPVFGHFLVWSQWSTAGFHQGSDSRHPRNPRRFPSLSSRIRAFCFSDPIQTKQQHMINATTWNYWLFSVSSSFGRNWYLGCPCGGAKLGKASECGTRSGPTALIRPVAC